MKATTLTGADSQRCFLASMKAFQRASRRAPKDPALANAVLEVLIRRLLQLFSSSSKEQHRTGDGSSPSSSRTGESPHTASPGSPPLSSPDSPALSTSRTPTSASPTPTPPIGISSARAAPSSPPASPTPTSPTPPTATPTPTSPPPYTYTALPPDPTLSARSPTCNKSPREWKMLLHGISDTASAPLARSASLTIETSQGEQFQSQHDDHSVTTMPGIVAEASARMIPPAQRTPRLTRLLVRLQHAVTDFSGKGWFFFLMISLSLAHTHTHTHTLVFPSSFTVFHHNTCFLCFTDAKRIKKFLRQTGV
jgi:hypothetical protein